jgi:hypothetical protein
VYVEEVSYRSKTIEGVPTSTTGFAGATRWGPVAFGDADDHPPDTEPRLITSFTEFERVYGGLDPLEFGTAGQNPSYLAHAARAFFMNGGKRLYVSRVFSPRSIADRGVASGAIPFVNSQWLGRWPGALGDVLVETSVVRSGNVAFKPTAADSPRAKRARTGTLVEVTPAGTDPPRGNTPLDATTLRVIKVDADGDQAFEGGQAPADGDYIAIVEFQINITVSPDRVDSYTGLGVHPFHPHYIGDALGKDDPYDEDAVVRIEVDPALDTT